MDETISLAFSQSALISALGARGKEATVETFG